MVKSCGPNSMNSDSSEDENLDLLREAAENQFTKHLFGSSNGEIQTNRTQADQPKSLRPCDDLKINDIHVTPGFQKFVAARLSNFLDSEIKETEGPPSISNKVSKGGIYLFSSSKHFAPFETVDDNINVKPPKLKHRRYYPKKCVNEGSIEECLRDAAVSADWILSQEAIRGWEKNTKGKLEVLTKDEVEIRTGNKKNERKTSTPELSLEEKQEKKRLKRLRSREKLKSKKINEKLVEKRNS